MLHWQKLHRLYVSINDYSVIGNNVIIGPNSVIGGEAFILNAVPTITINSKDAEE